MQLKLSSRTAIALLVTTAVGVGFGSMPYGYYSLLRLGICGFSLFLLFGNPPVRIQWQRWLLGASAVLYNPVLPVRIGDKNIWIVLNTATVLFFWLVAVRSER